MNEVAPTLVDMDKLGAEIIPTEVAKFAPERYRTQTTLSQAANDLRKKVDAIMRKDEEHRMWLKAQLDEILRLIG